MQNTQGLNEMRRLVAGFSVSIAISAVAELKIADHLAEGPKSPDELARLSGVDPEFLRRVLTYLASEGVFERQADDRFALTEMSNWLRADQAGSLRPRAVFVGSALNWSAWGKLPEVLKTGKSGMEIAFGQTIFDYVNSHPEASAIFNTFMAEQTAASVKAVLEAYDFAGVGEMVDVGGGRGALLAGVLKAYPAMQGVLFDLPEVVKEAAPLLTEAGVSERCRIEGGDFFKSVPAGADLYALKFILHDWPDEPCRTILKNCRQAMRPDGRVLIIEHAVPEAGGPHFSRFMDMNMMVMTDGGRERTAREFSELLAGAGLELRKVVPTAIGISVLECKAAS